MNEIPIAPKIPYRTLALYDSKSKETIQGVYFRPHCYALPMTIYHFTYFGHAHDFATYFRKHRTTTLYGSRMVPMCLLNYL